MDYFIGFLAGYFWKKVMDYLWYLSKDIDKDTNWIFQKYE